MELKHKLQMLMKARNLNGQKLARLSRVSDSEISRILQGKSRPGLDNALRLAQAVGVSLDYLADDQIEVEPTAAAENVPSAEDHKLLTVCKQIGSEEVQRILEIIRFLGYDVAMARLLGMSSKPVIERDDQVGELRPTMNTQSSRPAVTA